MLLINGYTSIKINHSCIQKAKSQSPSITSLLSPPTVNHPELAVHFPYYKLGWGLGISRKDGSTNQLPKNIKHRKKEPYMFNFLSLI